MKRKTTHSLSQASYLTSVYLTREDIEEIYQIISEACKRVVIEDREYEYASLEELEENRGKKIDRIAITGYEPYITFQVRFKQSTGVINGGEDGSFAPFFKIKAILENRKRVGWRFVFFGPPIFVTGLIFFAITYFLSDLKNNPYHEWIKGGLVIVLLGVVTFISSLHEIGVFSIVTLNKRHEQESFLGRNKDTIGVAIISALIGAFLTWLVTRLTSK